VLMARLGVAFSFRHVVLASLAIQINFASASGGDTPVYFWPCWMWFLYLPALKAGVPFETVVLANRWLKTDVHRVVLVWGSETALMEGPSSALMSSRFVRSRGNVFSAPMDLRMRLGRTGR
jgi:hypothetical protein